MTLRASGANAIQHRQFHRRLTLTDLEAAWNAVHDATPAGWHVGRPSYHNERDEWLMYAFDPSERAKVGIRSREWTARAESEEAVVREMARCLAELREGRPPR